MAVRSYQTFAGRLRESARLTGTFIKTPTGHATEILGLLGFDFVVFDMEHAAIDIGALDRMVLAARAAGVAGIVRVAEASGAAILSVLDLGATGILVPHVSSADRARAMVEAARYGTGKRGFANTTRAGDYGMVGYSAHKAAQDRAIACIAMIEDLEALDVLDEILAVPGLDAIFIGRGDLTAALGGEDIADQRTTDIVRRIAEAATRHGVPAMTVCIDGEDARVMVALGIQSLMIGSDQGFMAKAARAALASLSTNKED